MERGVFGGRKFVGDKGKNKKSLLPRFLLSRQSHDSVTAVEIFDHTDADLLSARPQSEEAQPTLESALDTVDLSQQMPILSLANNSASVKGELATIERKNQNEQR